MKVSSLFETIGLACFITKSRRRARGVPEQSLSIFRMLVTEDIENAVILSGATSPDDKDPDRREDRLMELLETCQTVREQSGPEIDADIYRYNVLKYYRHL